MHGRRSSYFNLLRSHLFTAMEDGFNVALHSNVFTAPEDIFERLEKEITYLPEEQCRIRFKNKSCSIPRKIVAFGDPELTYTFSGLTLTSQPWPSLLQEIKNQIETLVGFRLNFVLINRYENGKDCIGQHKDNESELDENFPICSLSFGETRTMLFKRPGFKDKKIELKSNSLLLMNSPTNKFWTHGIPRQKNRTGVRINLTFRMIKTTDRNDSSKRKLDEDEESSKKLKDDPPMDGSKKAEWCDSLDRKYLGGEKFLTVNHFLGQTRVHIRRYVPNKDGELYATKDGVSLSPKVWRSLCNEIKTVINHKSAQKVIVIERDLCISKQLKDGNVVYVFQRLFQRKNMSFQFLSEHVVLRSSEVGKLVDNMSVVTDRVKDGLITYTLSYHVSEELSNSSLEFNTVNNPDAFSILLDTLKNSLVEAISIKITELLNCFGCRESVQVDFMHDCLTKSRSEKWIEYFDQALYSINMSQVAKDIVRKNLTIDFNYVLGQEEFFDALDVPKILESLEKLYVREDNENMFDDLMIC